MLSRLIRRWESAEQPFLGPNIRSLEFWGILLPANSYKYCMYMTVHISLTIFIVSQFVDIWLVRNEMNSVLHNLKISMLSSVTAFKVLQFLYWQEKWKSILDYITRTDLVQRNTSDVAKRDIIKRYTKYARTLTNFYWSIGSVTAMIVIIQPFIKYLFSETYRENLRNGSETYLEVVRSWVPFDKTTLPGYIAVSIWQTYACIYGGGGWMSSYDANAVVMMVFFKGELELLKQDSADIFGTEHQPVAIDEALDRLKKCHRRHVELLKYTRLYDSFLSPIMLTYMFVCSATICVSAYQITIENDTMQRFLITEYFVFSVAQLLMYCWHSNDVLYASQELSLGPYESGWWRRAELRKEVKLLMGQFGKRIVFTAGPYTTLTVATFITMLRGAYSYYTLLSKSTMK